MGCDIYAHIEIKLNGQWEHWHAPKIERNYELFGKLAGVRNPNLNMFGLPKGLPENLTKPTLWDYEINSGHTASWLTWQELNKIMRWMDTKLPAGHQSHLIMGYLGGNDYRPYDEVTDIRMVFWFDN